MTCLFLSVICSCIIFSFAGGMYAPPVRVRIGSKSSFLFFEGGSFWTNEFWDDDLSGLFLSGEDNFRCFLRSESLSDLFSWCFSLSPLLKVKIPDSGVMVWLSTKTVTIKSYINQHEYNFPFQKYWCSPCFISFVIMSSSCIFFIILAIRVTSVPGIPLILFRSIPKSQTQAFSIFLFHLWFIRAVLATWCIFGSCSLLQT